MKNLLILLFILMAPLSVDAITADPNFSLDNLQLVRSGYCMGNCGSSILWYISAGILIVCLILFIIQLIRKKKSAIFITLYLFIYSVILFFITILLGRYDYQFYQDAPSAEYWLSGWKVSILVLIYLAVGILIYFIASRKKQKNSPNNNTVLDKSKEE